MDSTYVLQVPKVLTLPDRKSKSTVEQGVDIVFGTVCKYLEDALKVPRSTG